MILKNDSLITGTKGFFVLFCFFINILEQSDSYLGKDKMRSYSCIIYKNKLLIYGQSGGKHDLKVYSH